MSAAGTRSALSPALIRAVWAAVALLVALGVFASVGRTVFLDDFIARAEPVRLWTMTALGRDDPRALQRPAEVARMDGTFAAHPALTVLHVVPGGLFLLFAPLQFSSRMRARYLTLHRWSGRILLPLLIATVLPGLFFGVLMPFGGLGEAVAIALFGVMLLLAIVVAFIAVRRGQLARHREWMIRVFAFAIAISTVRLAFGAIDVALTPKGYPPADQFVLSVWTGWIVTLGAAEAWIRYTRRRVSVMLSNEITDGHQYRAVGKYSAAG